MLECQDVLEGSVISSLSAVARQNGFHAVEVPARRSPYVPVPINPEEMKKIPRNSKLRSQLRQKRRELDSKGGLRLLRVDRSDPSAMNRFYELESAGWKGNEGSAIACNPKIRQFYDEVSESAGRFGYLCMYFLELNGELLAAHFGLSHRGRYFSPKIAYNEKLPQYAPGHLIVGEILQDCAFRGISEYDITGVDDEWKMKWTSETRAKFTHFVFSPGVAGTLAHTVRFRFRPAVKKMIRR
jgi:CelD/BcsL family acetyltransferase involved in cellulose biosynthesis